MGVTKPNFTTPRGIPESHGNRPPMAYPFSASCNWGSIQVSHQRSNDLRGTARSEWVPKRGIMRLGAQYRLQADKDQSDPPKKAVLRTGAA
jgi:hypothetical protein